MGKMFESIMQGLQEAVEDAQGKRQLKRNTVQIEPLKEYTAPKIKAIRTNVGMSQKLFAEYLGVSPKTVEAWEAGKNKPCGTANRLLRILEIDPEIPNQFQFVKIQ
jgi:putative transcriptional regulator